MRIILADHHEQPLRALTVLVQEEPDFELVGAVEDGKALLKLAEKALADVVLMDKELPGTEIDQTIARLHELKPRPIVMVMSSELHNSRVILKAGADAFVSKTEQPEWLLEELHKYAREIKANMDADRNELA